MWSYRPGNPRVLVGSRHRSAVLSPSCDECAEPATSVISFGLDPAQGGARSMDEQCSQRDVPAFADPEEPGLASRRVFPWDHSQPGRKLAAVLELAHIVNGRDERGGPPGADPWDVCSR